MGVVIHAWSNFAARWWLLIVWIIFNGCIFWWSFFRYHHEARYYHIRRILGLGLCVSRGTAAVLHVCVFVAPIPVSRTLHWLVARVALPRRLSVICTAVLRRARVMHTVCVTTLLIASVIHTIAHVINAFNFSKFYNSYYPEINWASHQGQNPALMLFTSVVGLTGLGMISTLLMMAVCSLPRIRVSHYNLFWFSHHLALPLLVLYIAHPSSGLIKEMINYKEFSPDCEEIKHNRTTCKQPVFQAPKSMVWFWVSVPIILLLLDFGARLVSSNQQVTLSHAVPLPGTAVELWISSPGLSCTPGQYVLLQCPSVSSLEWHPYTVIKCPNRRDTRFTVIMRSRGDWSRKVRSQVLQTAKSINVISNKRMEDNMQPLRLYVNGPFASPLQQVISMKQAVCIGAGVGITPFISVIRYMMENDNVELPDRLHLIWLTPNSHQILWFAWTISSLHNKCWKQNKPDRFHFSIYVTRNWTQRYVIQQYPLIACRIYEGRPAWVSVFQQMQNEHIDGTVNVFGCGPGQLMRTLERHCDRMSRISGGPVFRFVRESYS